MSYLITRKEYMYLYDVEISIGISDIIIGEKGIDSDEIKWQPPLEQVS